MTFSEYIESLSGKKVAVIGCGVSNRPLLRVLGKSGAIVTAYDKKTKDELGDFAVELDSLGIGFEGGADYLDRLSGDVIFRTPGLRPDVPAISKAVENGAVLTSEMEVFFSVCPCPIIAITGSDGKTTTSTLISEILKKAGFTCHLGGNIGRPLLCDSESISPDDRAVVELSSFQLLTMRMSPSVAVVTNVAPNHLDVHHGMEEYIEAKSNIFRWQKPSDRVILNHENDITRGFGELAVSNVRFFSKKDIPSDGVYLADGVIRVRENGVETDVLPINEIRLPGIHNVENYMAAIAAVWGTVPADAICEVARTFGGVEHRIEFVREIRSVRYYNDSIATSPTRAIAGLRSFDRRIIMIAGGYDKKIPFEPMAEDVCAHVKRLILCGATAQKIKDAITSCPSYDPETLIIEETDDFTDAVNRAYRAAVSGDIVSLCPACAAFDRFPNFEVRGRTYKDIVSRLPE